MSQQNIFDNEEFFNGYKQLRENEDNYNVLLEQPAMNRLLPNLSGKRVLDLGCGYGHNCMDFVHRGAERVVGMDISQRMLDIANTESSHERIEYVRMSMTAISRLTEGFDLIYSSLAVHYIEDFEALCKDMYALLNQGGYLLFSQEHPLTTSTLDGEGHFNRDEEGKYLSYTFSNYCQGGKRVVNWFVDGVVKYHRTFSEILSAIIDTGLNIVAICEPIPDENTVEKIPKMAKELIKPSFLIVKAEKPNR